MAATDNILLEFDEYEDEAEQINFNETHSLYRVSRPEFVPLIVLIGRIIHAVVYFEANTPPVQRLLYCSVETRFKFMSYSVAQNVSPGRTFLGYSVYSGTYREAEQPINLRGRGNFMVYREGSLRRIDCPGVAEWEARAMESAGL
ncbi:hypothetical protein FB451DRAFT_1193976 [Mycena latifolia]|nr:hypothetical protein FB451DRAFT_1193976 [Mycena latifolia]